MFPMMPGFFDNCPASVAKGLSGDSFTRCIRDAFIRGLEDAGHEYTVSDLYRMNFKTDMTEKEYLRDAYYRNTPDLAENVLAEQAKINVSDAIVFIYPVFWSEAPAKLVGWFDRVWSYGFAYGEKPAGFPLIPAS